MTSETHYEVKIEETIVETRVVRVPKSEVNTVQDAANKAYEEWVVHGRCQEGTTIDVQNRTYEVDGQFYVVEADF